MSRSKKDGRKGGGHRDKQCKEFWSPRSRKVAGARMNKWGKIVTHRAERRETRQVERRELGEHDA